MTQSRFARGLAAGALAIAFSASLAAAHDYVLGALKIVHPWARPTPPGAPTAAGYLTLTNTGAAPDRLLDATTTAADKVEIHKESLAGGIMTMRPVPDGVVVPAHGSVKLAPGGYHLMFFGPKHPFTAGERIPVSLRFEHAGVARIDLVVEQPAMGGGSMGGMNMPGM